MEVSEAILTIFKNRGVCASISKGPHFSWFIVFSINNLRNPEISNFQIHIILQSYSIAPDSPIR